MVLITFALAVLIAIAYELVPLSSGGDNGPPAKTTTRLTVIATVLDEFEAKKGRYPTNVEGLNAAAKLAGVENPVVLRRLVNDGWGAPFVYREGSPPIVYSIGQNGIDEGGENDDVTLH